MATSLASLGWSDFFEAQHRDISERALEPMRVAIEHQDRYTLVGESATRDAHLTGLLLQEANAGGARPSVGDWVGLSESGRIAHLFGRRTAFQRVSPRGRTQVIAANIDLVLIVTSCNLEFNPRRLERYLSAVRQSGAQPALVLSKIDLCDALDTYLAQAEAVRGEAPVFPVATPSGQGLEALGALLQPGKTLALVGSSGVGKSTLANALLGVELFETAAIREQDAKGRHTTTRRELVVLPDERGVLIDTPGMRELQLTADAFNVDDAFSDIQELAQRCQFRNCRHLSEPGCAVRDVVDDSRLRNFQALSGEQKQNRDEKRQTERTVHRGSTRGRTRKKGPKK